jgi:integrase
LLKAVIDHAIRYKWARTNPVQAIAPDVRRARTEPIAAFEIEDIRSLLAAASQRYHKSKRRPTATLQCFVTMAAFLGMRWGEIAGLQRKHLDLESGVLRVRTSLSRIGGELHEPKTKAGRRDIRLPSNLLMLLRAYVTNFPSEGDGLVFTTANDLPIGYASWWTKSWSKLLDRAGLAGRELRFHALRHFSASWMIENGWPLPDVSAQLGHANVGITLQVYAHSIEKRAQSLEAMDELSERLTAPLPCVSALPKPDAPLRISDATPTKAL